MKEINSFNNNQKESNHITPKNNLKNIKSSYILKRIFNNILFEKLLSLIKYNNRTKKLLNITKNDYIEYTSQIEIEIIPSENKFSKFINVKHTDDNRKYFHIYFNNSNEERNRYYTIKDKKYKVKKVKILIDFQVKSFKELFKDCICIESITFKKFFRSNIIDMSSMFEGCK